MSRMTYLQASQLALAEELRRTPEVWVLGEDLGRGGVFGQYRGLQEEFGPERICDTPISESCIMGAAVGAALAGTRPVVEMRYSDFALCAVDELVNQAAKARYMCGGQSRVSLVVRQPIGMWRSSAAQHSQSLEAWYAHIPGLVVVTPGSAADNYGLLKAAIRCEDPVVYMEHKDLWAEEGDVEIGGDPIPLGKARLVETGRDLTIVSWSGMLRSVAKASELLEADGVTCDVIDLRTLYPWDQNAVYESVARTRRLLVVHESIGFAGFGGEIAAAVAEELGVPVKRLGAPRIPVPYSPALSPQCLISPALIQSAARQLVQN